MPPKGKRSFFVCLVFVFCDEEFLLKLFYQEQNWRQGDEKIALVMADKCVQDTIERVLIQKKFTGPFLDLVG